MLSRKKVMELRKIRDYVKSNIEGFTLDQLIEYIKTRQKRIDTFHYDESNKVYPVLKSLWWDYENGNYSFNDFATDVVMTDRLYTHRGIDPFNEFLEDYKLEGGSCVGTNLAIYHSHEYKITIKFDLNYELITFVAMSTTVQNKMIFEELKKTHSNFNFKYIDLV